MSPRLVVRRENQPERCDICHQSDLFNAENGFCQRCNTFTALDFRPHPKMIIHQEVPSSLSVIAVFLGIITFIPGMCLAPIGVCAGIAGLIVSNIEYRRISTGISPKASQSLVQFGFWSSLVGIAIYAVFLAFLTLVTLFA